MDIEKKYHKGEIVTWNGLSFRVSQPCQIADGRWKSNIYLLDDHGKKIDSYPIQAVSAERTNLQEKINHIFFQIALRHLPQMNEHINKNHYADVRLDTYVSCRRNAIQSHNKWAGSAEQYWKLWDKNLSMVFGNVGIKSCSTAKPLVDLMETITHRKSAKKSYSEKERKYWIVLGSIFQCAVDVDHLLDENPLRKIMRKSKEKLSTMASKDLARRSLTEEELSELLEICGLHVNDSDAFAAMRLQVLTGLTVRELCALDVGDWKKGPHISWLEVTKTCKIHCDSTGEVTMMLDSANAYRKVVCTEVVENLLSQQLYQLSRRGCRRKESPLFTDKQGSRLTPKMYKAVRKKVLDSLIHEGAHLTFPQRNGFLEGEDRPSVFHGDFLRDTAEYYYRRTCSMNISEIAALLGKNREYTFAIYYVDWTNEQVMMYLKDKETRWHSNLFSSSKAGDDLLTGECGLEIFGFAAPNAILHVHTRHGIKATIIRGQKFEIY